MTLAAVLLAGGRATRLGGVDKPSLRVGAGTLLERALAAARAAGADPVVVIGPDPGLPDVHVTREDPPYSGPAAALSAGIAALQHADRVLVLACDLARPRAAVELLLSGSAVDDADASDGWCLVDAAGRPQWLTAVYRTDALRRALGALPGGGRDAPMRAVTAALDIRLIPAPDAVIADIDTWEDLERARASQRDGEGERA